MIDTFRCGHPRTPENTYTWPTRRTKAGKPVSTCKQCMRFKSKEQKRNSYVKSTRLTLGQKIARGLI